MTKLPFRAEMDKASAMVLNILTELTKCILFFNLINTLGFGMPVARVVM